MFIISHYLLLLEMMKKYATPSSVDDSSVIENATDYRKSIPDCLQTVTGNKKENDQNINDEKETDKEEEEESEEEVHM